MKNLQVAISHLVAGRCIIIQDDASRENEGDLVCSAFNCSAENINFMVQEARGLVCLALPYDKVSQLELTMQDTRGDRVLNTAFTTSIDAAHGVTTGISAQERALTITTAASSNCEAKDLVTPGHIFPLRAHQLGLKGRRGHTEASIEMMRIAGLPLSAVICEIMNSDGSMARYDDLVAFADKFDLPFLSVNDIELAMNNNYILE